MKRDMDLVRLLLLAIEEVHDGTGQQVKIPSFDRPEAEVTEHLFLLLDAGFIDGVDTSHMGGRELIVRRMTFAGYDFLDSIRDEEIWKKTKVGAGAAGGFTVELLKDLAKGLIKQQIKKHTGLEI